MTQVPRLLASAVLSGLLYGLAFPPYELHGLAFIALIPWLLMLPGIGVVWAGVSGLVWSLVVGALTAAFLPEMIIRYFDLAPGLAWLAAAASVLTTGAAYALFAVWLTSWIGKTSAGPLVVACLWGACEWVRTVVPVANPWALSGYSQVPWNALMQNADWGGALVIGMLVAAINAALASVLSTRLRRGRRFTGLVATLVVAGLFLAYGHIRLGQGFASEPAARIALIQPAISPAERVGRSGPSRTFARQLAQSVTAGRQSPALIMWPENALLRPLDQPSSEWADLLRLARSTGADVLVGAPTRVGDARPDAQHNSFVRIRPDANSDAYHKVEPMPFSEALVAGFGTSHAARFEAGTSRRPLATAAGPAGILICNEIMLSRGAREVVREGAVLLANPANDAWFGARGAGHQLRVASVRSIETRRPLLRATQTGVSALIDSHGRVMDSAPYGERALVVGMVRPSTYRSPYVFWGDLVPQLGAALAGIGFLRLLLRRGSPGESPA